MQVGSCKYNADEMVTSLRYIKYVKQDDEETLRKVVAEHGPVVVAIDHRTRSFMVVSCWLIFFFRKGGGNKKY